MNTSTDQFLKYLRGSRDQLAQIQAFVQNTTGDVMQVQHVTSWLENTFELECFQRQLDVRLIDWREVATVFVREQVPVANRYLPSLVVTLLDVQQVLLDEPLLESVQSIVDRIETIKREWQTDIGPGEPEATMNKVVHLCRIAPKQQLLDALLSAQEALQKASSLADDVPFWDESGAGYEAIEEVKCALYSTWWRYQPVLHSWTIAHRGDLQTLLADAYEVLYPQVQRLTTYGVLEQALERIQSLRSIV